MTLFAQDRFDALLAGLPGVSFVDQWGSHVAKVGGKVFAVLGEDGGTARIAVKVAEESFEILTSLDGIGQAPYFAKRRWVSIADTAALTEQDLQHYILRSHDLVAAGLTKRLRSELGIVLPT